MKKSKYLVLLLSILSLSLSAQVLDKKILNKKIIPSTGDITTSGQRPNLDISKLVKPKLSLGKGNNVLEFSISPETSVQQTYNTKKLNRKTEESNDYCLNDYYESSGTVRTWKVFDEDGTSAVADIVPGAVYDISAYNGSFFTPIENLERNPIRISLTKSLQSQVTEAKVVQPKQMENIRDKGVKPIQLGLRAKVFGPTTRIKTDFKRQYSNRDLEVSLGGSIPYSIGKVTFKNKYSSTNTTNSYTYLLELEEDFYTLKATGNAVNNHNLFVNPPANKHNQVLFLANLP